MKIVKKHISQISKIFAILNLIGGEFCIINMLLGSRLKTGDFTIIGLINMIFAFATPIAIPILNFFSFLKRKVVLSVLFYFFQIIIFVFVCTYFIEVHKDGSPYIKIFVEWLKMRNYFYSEILVLSMLNIIVYTMILIFNRAERKDKIDV